MAPPGARGTKTDRLLQQGVAAHQAGDFARAERCYREILTAEPGHADALRFLGMVLAQRGDVHAALMLFQRALKSRPHDPALHYDLGNAHAASGDHLAAERCFRQVIAFAASFAEGHYGLGVALERQGKRDAAVACYQRAVRLAPDFAAAHLSLGGVLHDQGQLEEAVVAYRRVLELNPDLSDAQFNLGKALADQCRYAEAETHYGRALGANPDAVDTLNNLAATLIAQSRFPEAKLLVERALKLDPRCVQSHINLGALMLRELRFSEAGTCYQHALELDPGNFEARNTLGTLRLGAGDFANGWVAYQGRRTRRQFQANFPQVALATELPHNLSGKRVLLINEQGLGDELFFLRFAYILKRRGATLFYCASSGLTGLLARVACLDELHDRFGADEIPQHDIAVLVGDLPLLCADEEPTPAPLALTVLPERRAAMSARMAQLGPPPYRGVTWRAGTPPEEQRGMFAEALYKELPLEQLAAVLRDVKATWIALQRKPKQGEIAQFERGLDQTLHDLTDCNDDLEDMLALLTLLDDYLGVSNTNTHLRAGVGKTQRVIVPRPPEWRWMNEGTTSPWFPGFALYRQRGDGDWHAALGALAADLGSRC